jgi:S1-C subfamily serine protease
MDMEQLSKSQMILLGLLVSFVTSIATGIVTVSLMDQAPPAIAQTVNRVIERTVEAVAPIVKGQSAATVVTQEKTVVVKEADLISQAIAKVSPSIVRIFSSGTPDSAFLGLGIVLDANGTIVADGSSLGDVADASVQLPDGTRVRALVRGRDKDTGFAFLVGTSTASTSPAWKPATVTSDHAVLGDTVVALSGKTIPRIAQGLVTAFPADSVIDTDVSSDSIFGGSPLINTDGAIIGISTGVSRATSPTGFMSAVLLIPAPTPAK